MEFLLNQRYVDTKNVYRKCFCQRFQSHLPCIFSSNLSTQRVEWETEIDDVCVCGWVRQSVSDVKHGAVGKLNSMHEYSQYSSEMFNQVNKIAQNKSLNRDWNNNHMLFLKTNRTSYKHLDKNRHSFGKLKGGKIVSTHRMMIFYWKWKIASQKITTNDNDSIHSTSDRPTGWLTGCLAVQNVRAVAHVWNLDDSEHDEWMKIFTVLMKSIQTVTHLC